MAKDWHTAAHALTSIQISATPNNGPVTITGSADGLRCIGVGTDAAVFRHMEAPAYAFKLYAQEKQYKKEIEQRIYQQLGELPTLSRLHAAGDNFLVLHYEPGPTLYDCLLQGIHIPGQAIKDVNDTRAYIRQKGLNPRDIHLKNIILQDGRAKILDLSEYENPGNDFRWEHLAKGYAAYYHYIDGKPIPFWLLETIRKWYNQTADETFTLDEFMRKIARLTLFWK
ncbi:serine/threonine protein kinase [Thalassobacillus pellis]|uniref:serine/threonine protein kinase n=1 Tax=Thalassobacillus pellis TaxID=748008 RepID=UPI00195F3353|nr:serine/threonine protein kinase [Thalassobacillus pellis]MBM7554285.1 hypothetical protein [Thalassobacillus pellis]